MRVLCLLTDAFGGYGGIAQYNRDFLLALNEVDSVTKIDVLVRISPDSLENLPSKVDQRPAIESRVGYTLKAFELALSKRPDVIFCGHLYFSALASILGRILGCPVVVQLHGTEIWSKLKRPHLWGLDQADTVLCVSRDTKARLTAQSKREYSNALVIPNTLGSIFTPGDKTAARKRFGLGSERAIGTVARLPAGDGYKGHDRVIRALGSVQTAGRETVYLIAGTGPDEQRLKALAEELGVSGLVRFLGKVPNEDLLDVYRAIDLFALPSTGEGFGIVFLEAMGCGTPAIGLDVGGIPDALADGALGWCATEDGFAADLKSALNAPAPDRELLSKAVHARFGRDVFARNVAGLFESSRLTDRKGQLGSSRL